MWPHLFRQQPAQTHSSRTGITPGAVLVGSESPDDPAIVLRPVIGRRVWFRPLAPGEDPGEGLGAEVTLGERDIKGTLLSVTATEVTVTFSVLAAPLLAGLGTGAAVLLRIPSDGGVYEAFCSLRQLGGEEGEYFLSLTVPPEIFRLQRRSFVRVPCHLDAELWQEGWPVPRRAHVVNLSGGGVGLIAGLRPEVGDRFELHIRGRSRGLEEARLGDDGLGPLKVEVRRMAENLRGLLEVGAVWVDLSEAESQKLVRLLKVLEQMRLKEGKDSGETQ
ncbi:MAG: flagellar brake protein [Symbiobacteriia bacterium]